MLCGRVEGGGGEGVEGVGGVRVGFVILCLAQRQGPVSGRQLLKQDEGKKGQRRVLGRACNKRVGFQRAAAKDKTG